MAISTGVNDNINTCLNSIKTFVDLIQSFIDENKSNSKYDENFSPKNGIMLKGIIQIHTSNCIKEDCPLTNFVKNEGNFSTQKQCLLNYMTILFNEAMRKMCAEENILGFVDHLPKNPDGYTYFQLTKYIYLKVAPGTMESQDYRRIVL